jgi:DNA-binding transcriptional LysR family regulator
VIAYAGFLGQGVRGALRQSSHLPLTVLPVKALSIPRHVMVTYRKDAYLSPAARRFIEILNTTARKIAAEN